MARTSSKRDSKATYSKGKIADVVFVNYSITDDDRKFLKSQQWALDDFDSAVLKIVEAGYKVSMQYDTRNSCYACFIIAQDSEHENAGYILTGRGSSPSKAVKQAIYVGFHILEGVFSNINQFSQNNEIDD
jgi:hypothetical protein